MVRDRSSMAQPLLGSFLLHGGLAVAMLVSWDWLSRPVRMEASVPVTLVAEAPIANVRPAVEAPAEAEALTEDPVPDATPEPAAPPAPPEPLVVPKSPPPPKPAPKQKAAKPQPTLDLDALADSLKPSRPPKPKSSAQKGRARPESAIQSRLAAGQADALAASALKSLSADLARRWNPNCAVEGGREVMIEATFRLNTGGRVVGTVEASGERASNPVVKAASDRAKEAVYAAQPFENLPEQLYGERITVRFNAQNACATG